VSPFILRRQCERGKIGSLNVFGACSRVTINSQSNFDLLVWDKRTLSCGSPSQHDVVQEFPYPVGWTPRRGVLRSCEVCIVIDGSRAALFWVAASVTLTYESKIEMIFSMIREERLRSLVVRDVQVCENRELRLVVNCVTRKECEMCELMWIS